MFLKLLALDSHDLTIISAYSQKSEVTLENLHWIPEESRLILAIKRFCWEKNAEYTLEAKPAAIRNSILHFDRIEHLSVSGIDCKDKTKRYRLLAIHFVPKAHKEIYGYIMLHFEGNAALRLSVECIEARLVDI